MRQYLDLLRHVLENGEHSRDRTGVGTIAWFGDHYRCDLSQGFPLLTTKRVFFKGVLRELLWFLKGETNIRPLLQVGVHIWSEWPHARFQRETGTLLSLQDFEARILEDASFAAEWGDLGPVYGKQWRRWKGADGLEYDQVAAAVETLRTKPWDRGIIVSGWKVDELSSMALRPCHTLYQWNVSGDGTKLDCLLFQRSADVFLGVPFNTSSAAIWTHMMAQVLGLQPGSLVHMFGNVHIYNNHLDQVREQLGRVPRALPRLRINPAVTDIDSFTEADFTLEGYEPWPAIKAPVAV